MAITNTSLDTYTQEIYHSYGENAVTTIYLCNTSGNTVMVDLHACKANTTPSTSNLIYYQLPIAAGDTYVIDTEKLILETDDTLQAFADTGNAVVATTISIGI
jgi:hypothetical protein